LQDVQIEQHLFGIPHGNTAALQQIHKEQGLPTNQVPNLLIRQRSPVKKLDEQERRWL